MERNTQNILLIIGLLSVIIGTVLLVKRIKRSRGEGYYQDGIVGFVNPRTHYTQVPTNSEVQQMLPTTIPTKLYADSYVTGYQDLEIVKKVPDCDNITENIPQEWLDKNAEQALSADEWVEVGYIAPSNTAFDINDQTTFPIYLLTGHHPPYVLKIMLPNGDTSVYETNGFRDRMLLKLPNIKEESDQVYQVHLDIKYRF